MSDNFKEIIYKDVAINVDKEEGDTYNLFLLDQSKELFCPYQKVRGLSSIEVGIETGKILIDLHAWHPAIKFCDHEFQIRFWPDNTWGYKIIYSVFSDYKAGFNSPEEAIEGAMASILSK